MAASFLEATRESGKTFFSQDIPGEVLMLNLLRFRDIADYADSPELMPHEPISGRAAYQRYVDHTLPLLSTNGGEVVFQGRCGAYLIGPPEEEWDWMLLVRHKSRAAFMALTSDEAYQAGVGHRTAALLDSRLLPVVEHGWER